MLALLTGYLIMLNPVVATDASLSKRGDNMAQSTAIQIGELARRTGCDVETIRYYERVGVLPRPSRSAARYRLYDSDDVQRLTFVRRARELGFTVDEVRALLMARVLSEAVRRCDAGEVPGCPLIDTLTASAPLHLVARRSARKPTFAAA
jgi:MerR family transcriptional regulator, mercuric resistance operon regulatory protein